MLIIVLKANGDIRRIHCCASLNFFNQYQIISLIYMLLKFPYECQKKMLECKVNSCNKISLYRESSFSLFAIVRKNTPNRFSKIYMKYLTNSMKPFVYLYITLGANANFA